MRRLRLLIEGPRSPRANMAIDEAILLAGPDTLRIYTWSPPGLSLGRSTPLSGINFEEAVEMGIEVVRRPTGGAALYHDSRWEVTYSLVISDPEILRLDIESSAALIARGVAEAARMLGAEDVRIGGFKGPGGEILCYLNPGSSDVIVRGRKISGSAQLRRHGRILQQGTLLIHFEAEIWSKLIPTRTPREHLDRYVAGLSDITGREVELEEALNAMVDGFRRALGLELEPGSLSAKEAALASRLAVEKYSSREWLYARL